MNNIKKKLIDTFAQYSMPELEENNWERLKDSLGIQRYEKFAETNEYKENFKTLRRLREELDVAIDLWEGLQQVKECLNWLAEKNEEVTAETLEICVKLIEKGIYTHQWNQAEQIYYEVGRKMITTWKDLFLSYTNRNLHDTNDDFKDIIRGVFGEDDFNENIDKVNCVARLLVHYFDKHNLKTFFDQHNMTCGDVIEDEIYKYCTSTYTFVQLVELETLHEPQDKPNWCHREFEKFDGWCKETGLNNYKRYYFVLTDGNVFPAALPPHYTKWTNKISGRIHITDLSTLGKKQIRNKVGEIAREIVKTKKQMIEDYCS